ncbi:MAG: GNAT family N-acetyltransferase [Christensenella sp.]|nr:GNAT family N-acetyltransferase [Christensenella sp.]
MLSVIRCTGKDKTFAAMVAELDEELNERYGAQMEFFGPHNHSQDVQNAVVVYWDDMPAGCGCFKPFSADAVEMKRIFVQKVFRGRKLARAVMTELEAWAKEEGYSFAVLETGVLQPEAIRLYEAAGYGRIPNYPPYVGVKESICYRKKL